MFNLQGSEIIVILLLALVVLGPEKLPDAIRRFSQTYSELKKMGTGFQTELKSALDEPMKEMRETAKMVRDAADPTKIATEAEAERRLNDGADAASEPSSTDAADGPAPSLEGAASVENGGIEDPVATPAEERSSDDDSFENTDEA